MLSLYRWFYLEISEFIDNRFYLLNLWRSIKHSFRWYFLLSLNDLFKLIELTLRTAFKQSFTKVKLVKYTPKRPYVYLSWIRQLHYNLWGSIVSRLNVFIHFLVWEACISKVYDFDARFALLFKHDIFGFQIAMNNIDIRHAH